MPRLEQIDRDNPRVKSRCLSLSLDNAAKLAETSKTVARCLPKAVRAGNSIARNRLSGGQA
jgi:hypothetical protein